MSRTWMTKGRAPVLAAMIASLALLGACGPRDKASGSAVSASGSSATEVSGHVMVYTSAEDAFISKVVSMFNEKFPKAKAEYYRSGTEEVISKLLAEQMTNSVQADVIMVSDAPTFEMLKGKDLLQAYESPELSNIFTEYVDPDRMYYGTFPAAMGIMYNRNLVKAAPTSWKDLCASQAKGNSIMPNPLYSGTAAYAMLVLTKATGLGWEYYRELADNGMKVVNGNGGVVNSVSAGETSYGMVVDSNALAAAAKGAPVAFVYPSEGVPATADPVGILKGTKNVAGARAFLDYMLQEDVQKLGRDTIFKTPIRKGLEAPAGSLPLDKRSVLAGDAKAMYAIREEEKAKFKKIFNQ